MTNTSDSTDCKEFILIADDDFDTQKILSDCLNHHGFQPIVAIHGEHALELAQSFAPSLALVDVQMPGPSGLSLAEKLKKIRPGMEVIIITAYGTIEHATEAMRQGVFHYLPKPLNLQEVIEIIHEALKLQRLQKPASPPNGQPDKSMSPRQLSILRLLAEGKTNKEIGAELGLSDKTVANHVGRILHVLEVPNRTVAAVKARKLGFL